MWVRVLVLFNLFYVESKSLPLSKDSFAKYTIIVSSSTYSPSNKKSSKFGEKWVGLWISSYHLTHQASHLDTP
jgi:hypothetical protein